jgi:hypothetical protein
MVEDYEIGDAVYVSGTFRSLAGVLADPTDVTCDVMKPDGTAGEATDLAQVSTGIWSATIEPDIPGRWRYRFAGTGAVQRAKTKSFWVKVREVPAA